MRALPLLLLLAACAAPSSERLIGTIPEGVDDRWASISRDGSVFAYADRAGTAGLYLVVNDRRLGPFV